MEKTKKATPAAPGKKKVIRRLVKNAKTGEVIKTEIVRIDSSGEMTVTSYPAGTPVPSLSSLQTQSSSQTKKIVRKTSTEAKSISPKRKTSQDSVTPQPTEGSLPALPSPPKPKSLDKQEEINNAKPTSTNVGPSVPANVPGLEDLLKKEEELRRFSESERDRSEKPKAKQGEESLETALISIMKRKRQRDPKARRRGLVASTKPRRPSDDETEKGADDGFEDTDYRSISKKEENQEDEEAERKRRERHRRRKEKKHKERSQADRDDVEEYQGETGPLDLPEIESYRKREEETPMEGVENGGPQLPEGEETELAKKLEDTTIKPGVDGDTQPPEKEEEDSASDDDKKKKKKKHKHKKKKKKTKKQKKRESKSGSEKEEQDKEEKVKLKSKSKSRSRSRSRSLSSISLSSISSAFSDSFDFAGMNFDPGEEGGFDMALVEYQQMREQVLGGPFAGRGFDPYFRGRGGFRGMPRFPGPFQGAGWRPPGPFHFFQPDPNFGHFPGGPMGADGEKGGNATGRGRGVPANQGPWRGRGLRGRGIPPGFHRNYTEDDQGGAVYVEENSSSSSDSGGRKKKKKKHRRRSYSSSSYSDSGSSRSRSRSRRRHRRRHRSSSYSSRSSRSYSSYSSRSRSYSRSSRSRSSYSRSSYSRSRSRSSKRSKSRTPDRGPPKPWGYDNDDVGRRASPSYHAYDEDGFKPPVRDNHSDDEEVPWWAEFDKTYEVEKKKLEEEKKKLEEEERKMKGEPAEEPQPPSIVSTEEIEIVRCVMNLVDKARSQQDEALETARECIDDIITKISVVPVQATQLHEEVEDPFEKVIHDCVDSILDRVCPNDPQTAARLCLKEIIDTVVEQEEEDKANAEATEMEKEITESKKSRLFQCYLKAQKLTEQMKTERKSKGLPEEKGQTEDEKQKSDDKRKDKRGHRSRHRRRSRSRSRDRGRRRRRHSSSDSRSSSRSSDARVPLVSEESLRQAQALLTMQQQQLQVAGLLGTGMPNLAGLTQAAALAAGITPALLAQTGLKSSDLPTLMGEKGGKPKEKEEAKVQPKWDKEKVEAMSKKDDLTRKLMQRMKEKKMKQEDGSDSPTFQGRKEKGVEATTEKVFTGGNLKSRKIAISSTFGKLWSKVEGSPRQDDDVQDISKGYNKSDIVAATSEVKDQPNAEKLKAEEQEKKLAAWSDQQARLKEEAQREMREQIERAERAKKEKMKEEILEQERQREIMRIREEVRSQIRREIQEEIEKERKTVMEDPAVRGRLLELEALRSQSGLIASDGVKATASSSNIPAAAASTPTPSVPGGSVMRDQRWYQQQMKNKQDMTKWMESHGYYMSEMDDATLKRMQVTYMQNWTPAQRQGYMQWYWQQKQYMGPGYYPQHMMGRQSQASQVRPVTDYPTRDPVFTHAPSQPQRSEHPGMGVHGPSSAMAQRMPYPGRGMPAQHGIPGQQQGRVIPSLMDQKPVRGHSYDQTDRQNYDYSHERYPGARDQYWQGEELKRQAGQNAVPPPQHQPPPVSQQKPANVASQQPQEIPSLVSSGQMQIKQDPTPAQPAQRRDSNPPLHQYPPPGIEEDDDSTSVLKPIPPQVIQQSSTSGQGQPPPPGEVEDGTKPIGDPMANELAPPGEDAPVQIATPALQPGQVVLDDDSPSKSKKKKKQKKHRKHKKKKYSSSEEEEEELDPEAEKAKILAKLQHLKDVEDGEIASDDAAQATAEQEEKDAARKKKKHKREKKKHKKRRDDSSDEEQPVRAPQQIQTVLPPPPAYMHPPGMPGHLPFDPARPTYPGAVPEQPDHQYPPPSASGRYGIDPPNMYPPPDPGFIRRPRDHRGSGEPQHMAALPEHRKPPMGPSGDHNPQRKRSPSPLPLVIPTDPQEYEIWQRKMHAKYNDGDPPKERPGVDGPSIMDQQLLKDINTLRRRQGVRDRHGGSNDDVIMMMRMIDDEQRRQRLSPLPHDHHPPREGRKRGHGAMSRGRKRQRRLIPRKNYHDWDKPEDDGLIYARSGSDSSGWGSDTNMDFDRMLAKKRRETEKDQRDGHPPQPPGWDRRNIMPRNEDLLQGEKPQGIPVIGGGPRPIPTNVSSNRPTPPHHHPDMLPPTDYLPPDVMKLPPSYPGYHHDPHRDPRYAPPPVASVGHPIQRLGAQPLPPPPIMPPMQPRMHPMDYRPRYGM